MWKIKCGVFCFLYPSHFNGCLLFGFTGLDAGLYLEQKMLEIKVYIEKHYYIETYAYI